VLDGLVYVFGGASLPELDHIVSFDPTRSAARLAGTLPRAQSDVAVAETANTAYVIGGFDGTDWLDTILAWRPGSRARVAGHLPVGLRYAAVGVAGGRLIILGGSTSTGASRSVDCFDPRTGRVQMIGRLPHPTTHAAAATLGGYMYLVGGRGDGLTSQYRGVWSVDPRTGAVRSAGRLPKPLSDSAVVALDDTLVVAGGLSPQGVRATVGELVPTRPREARSPRCTART
jgi:N-acetylneuraminic acid mutarotase